MSDEEYSVGSNDDRSMKISFSMPDGTEVPISGDATFSPLNSFDIAVPEAGAYKFTYTSGSFTVRFTRRSILVLPQHWRYKSWPLKAFKRGRE